MVEIPFVANGAGRYAVETAGMKRLNDSQLRLVASSRGTRPANQNPMRREHRYGASWTSDRLRIQPPSPVSTTVAESLARSSCPACVFRRTLQIVKIGDSALRMGRRLEDGALVI